MTDAADIVSKIREALEYEQHDAWVERADGLFEYRGLPGYGVDAAVALLPQLESLLAKEPVSLVMCGKAAINELKRQMGGRPISTAPEQVDSWTAQGDVYCTDFELIAKAVLDAANITYVESEEG